MIPVHDVATVDFAEIITWGCRGLLLPAGIGLFFAVRRLWCGVQEWRWYREPLGFSWSLALLGCAIASAVIIRASLF